MSGDSQATAKPATREDGFLGRVSARWQTGAFRHYVIVREGQVDPQATSVAEMTLIAPNHVESMTGRLLQTESASEQGAESGKYWCDAGDVIYSKIRPALRKVVIAPHDCLCSADMYPLKGANGLSNRFLYWYLLSEPFSDFALQESARVAMPKLNRETLAAAILPLPTPGEQECIANFLDEQTARIDALIAEKERLVLSLDEWRQSWLSAELFQAMPCPEKRLKFCLLTGLQYGATESGDPEASGPRYIRITDIRADGTLAKDDAKYLTEEQGGPYLLEDGDVLFARSGATVGKSFVYSEDMGRCAYAGYLIKATLDQRLLLPKYLRLLTETHQYWAYLRGAETQSTIQNASAEKYANFAFPLPPVDRQRETVERLEEQLNKVARLTAHAAEHIDRLHEYRSSLISAAVTGQLDISTYRGRANEPTC